MKINVLIAETNMMKLIGKSRKIAFDISRKKGGPPGQGFEARLSFGHISQIFRLIVLGDPCLDMTKAVEEDVKP